MQGTLRYILSYHFFRHKSYMMVGFIVVLFLFFFENSQAQTICSSNKITNGTFDNDISGWTVTPGGWKHGSQRDMWVSSNGTHTAMSNVMSLCQNSSKQVKFKFTESWVGNATLTVRLGGMQIFEWSSGTETTPSGVTLSKSGSNYTFLIDSYSGAINGSLEFTFVRSGLLNSRRVSIDDVEVYEVVSQPFPTQFTACTDTTFDLTTLQPSNINGVNYIWSTSSVSATQTYATPTAAERGTYYLYAESLCSPGCYSPASLPVIISPCCGQNRIKNGNFDLLYSSNGTNGAILNNTPKLATVPFWGFASNEFTNIGIGPFVGGNTVLGMDPKSGIGPNFYQDVSLCPGEKVTFTLNFGMRTVAAVQQNRVVSVSLAEIKLFDLNVYNAASDQVAITNINKSILSNLRVNGAPYTPPDNTLSNGYSFFGFSGSGILSANTLHSLSVVIDYSESAPSGPRLNFAVNQGAVPFFDNVSLSVDKPTAKSPKLLIPILCPKATFDLTLAEPDDASYIYRWHTANNTNAISLVSSPKAVPPGVYYMYTFSSCSGCHSAAAVPFTVNGVEVNAGNIAISQAICKGEAVNLSSSLNASAKHLPDNSTLPISYQWLSGTECDIMTPIAGANTSTYTTGKLNTTMYYKRVAYATYNGVMCSDTTDCVVVTVNPLPNNVSGGGFDGGGICEGVDAKITYNARNSGFTAPHKLTYTDGTNTYTQTIATADLIEFSTPYTITQTTTFTLLSIEDGNGCVNSGATIENRTAKFTVKAVPVCNIAGNRSVCPKNIQTYTANTGMSSYSWSVTGATISGTANSSSVDIVPGSSGTAYTLTLRVENADGCSSSCTKEVTVVDTTAPTFDVPDTPLSVCVNNIIEANYNNITNGDVNDPPDYYEFAANDTALDISNLQDNCCAVTPTISWSISPASKGVTISGAGQPSQAIGGEKLWLNISATNPKASYVQKTYTITYQVKDCNGNTATQTRAIIVKPRPKVDSI